MKRLLLVFLLFSFFVSFSYGEPPMVVAPTSSGINNFVLYPTTNVYTFLKLDTRNGKIWQVQYSMDENEFEVVLNNKELVANGKPGQFALYPTTNNWTFILLDTVKGATYHVQWSQDADKRIVIPIRNIYDNIF